MRPMPGRAGRCRAQSGTQAARVRHTYHPRVRGGGKGLASTDKLSALAVAPRHVDDPPALPCLQELEEIDIERAANGGARDAFRYVVDLDLDPAIGDVLSLPLTARGHVDHLSSRERADAFGARRVALEGALGQLRMKRSLHPRAIPIEPSLDVVACRVLNGGFVTGCGFLGPDGSALHQHTRRVKPFLASGAREVGRSCAHPAHGRGAALSRDTGRTMSRENVESVQRA